MCEGSYPPGSYWTCFMCGRIVYLSEAGCRMVLAECERQDKRREESV